MIHFFFFYNLLHKITNLNKNNSKIKLIYYNIF